MVRTCESPGGKRGYEEIQEAKRNEEGNSAIKKQTREILGGEETKKQGNEERKKRGSRRNEQRQEEKVQKPRSKEIWNKQTTVRDFTAPCRLSLTMSKSWGGELVAHLS